MAETWKQIPGWPGYEVSDHGRVRSGDRVVVTKDGHRRCYRGQMLRPGRSSNGYLTVALGVGNSRCVHELVLLAFVGPCPAGHLSYHEDDVRERNQLSNLRWGTPSENNKNVTRLGKRMFTYEEAETIKKELAAGGDALILSQKLGCTRRHLYNIKLGAQYVRN